MIQKMHNIEKQKPFTTRVTTAKQKKGTGSYVTAELSEKRSIIGAENKNKIQ